MMPPALLAAGAFARVPASCKGPATFTRPSDSAVTTGVAFGVPARASAADAFRDAATIRDRVRDLVVLPTGLGFAPAAGQRVSWEGATWAVLGVSVLSPNGTDVALYRVTVQR